MFAFHESTFQFTDVAVFFNQSSFVVEIQITFKRYSHYRTVVIYVYNIHLLPEGAE